MRRLLRIIDSDTAMTVLWIIAFIVLWMVFGGWIGYNGRG